jgi:membrane protein implicated in regulation of membrane protease activity
MQAINKDKMHFNSTISYIISGIILLAVLVLLLSSLALSILGIVLFVVGLIISLIISLIVSLIISVIRINTNSITIKTMTGKSKQISILSESGGWCESIG